MISKVILHSSLFVKMNDKVLFGKIQTLTIYICTNICNEIYKKKQKKSSRFVSIRGGIWFVIGDINTFRE
jgi:hypothetical protein